RFEIEARRHAHIGVRRPCEAIDAAMLAAAIGIDGAVERNVGGTVAGDDGARLFYLHLGLEGGKVLERLPSVIEHMPCRRLEAARWIDAGTPTAPAIDLDANAAFLDQRIRHSRSAAAARGNVVRLSNLFHLSRLRACSLFSLLPRESEQIKNILQRQLSGQPEPRRRCSSRRGRISTKLQGLWR